MEKNVIWPAEWAPQDAVQLTWPHDKTDWASYMLEVVPCYVAMAKTILRNEYLVVVCQDEAKARWQLGEVDFNRVKFVWMKTNDTWARDHAPLSVRVDGKPTLLDFVFNGWGMKYAANHDNLISRKLYQSGYFADEVEYVNKAPFVLEGGSVESDGEGTILTTESCLLSPNRNDHLTKDEIEAYLKEHLGAKRVLWLTHGYLAGDDTDGHVDMLARFTSPDTIVYVKCENQEDEHFEELSKMEEELRSFRQANGEPYRLIGLPMADAIYDENKRRLPASYANFLILNHTVLVPTYLAEKDKLVLDLLRVAFPDREVVGLNCLPLIKQHGSLHCATMQYPEGFVKGIKRP